jgi:hypothetical protein
MEQSDYKGYFPNANFNSIINYKSVFNYNINNNNKGDYLLLNGNMNTINAFLLGGKIIPFQNTKKVLNSKDLRNIPISIIINPDNNKFANGNIIFDNDGKDVIKNKDYLDINIKFEKNTLIFIIENMLENQKYNYLDDNIESIIILRAKELDKFNSATISIDGNQINKDIIYDEINDLFKIEFNEYYKIQNFENIIFKTTNINTINKEITDNNNIVENNVDQLIDNQNENKENNNKDNTITDNEEKNNKDNIKNNNVKDKEENKETKVEIKHIEKDSYRLILVKVFIGIIFFLLSIIIILFVRIKSLQKKKANYIELAGLDPV